MDLRSWTAAAGSGVVLLLAATPAMAKDFGVRPPQRACASMAGLKVPAGQIRLPTRGAEIRSAVVEGPSGQGTPDFVPEHCNLTGTITPLDPAAPPIQFRVLAPTRWSQKALQIGGNGMNGFIPLLATFNRGGGGSPQSGAYPPDARLPIAEGYATFGGDSGHGGATAPGAPGSQPPGAGGAPPPQAFDWMKNDEAFRNFGGDSVRKTHDAAMFVLRAYYGAPPRITLFGGESQGGREALVAATRFADDYDGILTNVPLTYFTGILLAPIIRQQWQLEPGAWVPPEKVRVIRDEVLRQCDALDGLADGVVNNYRACNARFDTSLRPGNPLAAVRCPDGQDSAATCLSDAQIRTVNRFHAPIEWGFPIVNGDTDWPGVGAANEGAPGWVNSPARPRIGEPTGGPGAALLRALAGDPNLDPLKLDLHAQEKVLRRISDVLDNREDWSALGRSKRRTKLLFYSADPDYLVNARGHQRLFDRATAKTGKAVMDRQVRFYVAPNVAHQSNGASATTGQPLPQHVNLLAILEAWAEDGRVPPDALEQDLKDVHPPYRVLRSKPLCRYPTYPHYVGPDPDRAASYRCRAP